MINQRDAACDEDTERVECDFKMSVLKTDISVFFLPRI